MHQTKLPCKCITAESLSHDFFLLPFGVLRRKSNISWCLKTSKYMSQTLLYVFQPLKTSRAPGMLHFNLEKHQWSFDSWFLISQYLIHGSLLVSKTLNTCGIPIVFIYSVRKRWWHLSCSSLASKNNSDTLFDDCLILNTVFYRFLAVLTSKYINQIYVDAI